ncbi:OB-fold domain-containing protein [Comamonadaceae bacterium G21597-S1]|nr:OB-fold domain-containing protein [Comamonadaceae bacterium G21597-S1]
MQTHTTQDGPPSAIHPEQQYQAYLAQGSFMLLRAKASGRFIFYPRVAEPLTGDTDLEWVPASGLGRVYSVTVVRKRPPEQDYNVALIDLQEGPRMMSRVEGIAPADVRIGMAVRARIVQQDDQPLLVFEPATA